MTSSRKGQGEIDQAHSYDEWVEIRDVARGAEILAEAMLAIVLRGQLSGTSYVWAVSPPSTTRLTPVTYCASSDAR